MGGLGSWRVGAEYRPTGILALRGSFSAAEGAPSMVHLHATEAQGHPYVLCDPGAGPPPRTCPEKNVRQVAQELSGNPKLDPVKADRLAFGAEARQGPFFLAAEWYRLSNSKGVGNNTATHAMLNLPVCEGDARENCIERNGGDITIHRGFENVVESETSGINLRFGGGMRTSWGIVGMRGAWRHVLGTKLRVAGANVRNPFVRNAVRAAFLARRGNLSAIWTANYRAGFKNQDGSGEFKSWTGHDLSVDWADPLGLRGARVSAGVLQSHRHAAHHGHVGPLRHGRARRGRLGPHLLPHHEHALLRTGSAAGKLLPRSRGRSGEPRQRSRRPFVTPAPEPGSIHGSRCRRSRWRTGRTAEATARTKAGPRLGGRGDGLRTCNATRPGGDV